MYVPTLTGAYERIRLAVTNAEVSELALMVAVLLETETSAFVAEDDEKDGIEVFPAGAETRAHVTLYSSVVADAIKLTDTVLLMVEPGVAVLAVTASTVRTSAIVAAWAGNKDGKKRELQKARLISLFRI